MEVATYQPEPEDSDVNFVSCAARGLGRQKIFHEQRNGASLADNNMTICSFSTHTKKMQFLFKKTISIFFIIDEVCNTKSQPS